MLNDKNPLLFKILSNWRSEPERPPLLLNGVQREDWTWLKEDIINIFTNNDIVKPGHPDILLLEKDEKKQTIEVEKTRDFIDQLAMSNFELPFKLGFIPNAQYLNISSQNALLKTLEEPLRNRYLILGIASKNKLLATILSRCAVIELNRDKSLDGDESALRNEVIDLYNNCLKATSVKCLQKGIAWSGNNPSNIVSFFEFILPELKIRLKENLAAGDAEASKKISYQIKKVLDCQDQLGRNSGANPKLLFEAFLLQL